MRIAAPDWCAFAVATLALALLFPLRAGPLDVSRGVQREVRREERSQVIHRPYPAIDMRSASRGLMQQDMFGINPERVILYAPAIER